MKFAESTALEFICQRESDMLCESRIKAIHSIIFDLWGSVI